MIMLIWDSYNCFKIHVDGSWVEFSEWPSYIIFRQCPVIDVHIINSFNKSKIYILYIHRIINNMEVQCTHIVLCIKLLTNE